MIDKIIKYFPGFYVLLVFIGYSRLYFYYINFNISIYEYISLFEVLFSFLPLIISITISLIIILAMDFFFTKNYPKNHDQSIEEVKLKLRIKYIRLTYAFSIILFAQIILVLYLFIFRQKNFYEVGILLTSSFSTLIYIFISQVFLKNLKNKECTKAKNRRNLTITFLSLAYIGLILHEFYSSELILNGQPIKNIEFTCDQSLIRTDKNLLFVGSVQNYIFCYDIKSKKTIVFPKSNLTNLKIWGI